MKIHFLAALFAFFMIIPYLCHAVDRTEIPESDQWDLTVLFPTPEAWSAAKQALEARIPEVEKFRGRLGEGPGVLLGAATLLTGIRKDLNLLSAYASQLSDLDVRDPKAMGMKESLVPLAADLGARAAWLEPEILSLPEEKIASYYKEEPALLPFKPVIDDILRLKAHILSPGEEKIMADAGLISGTADSVYSLFSDADIPRTTVTLSGGETVRLDASAYTYYRGVPNRWDRELVFQSFFGNLNQFRGTFGSLLNGEVKKNLFVARARKYESALASALSGPDIPTAVYYNLIDNVHKNLPTLWRYLDLRKRMMGLDRLRYSDLYASIVKEVDVKYTPEEARKLVLEGVAPLGEDYVKVLAKGFEERWVDWYPTPGKRSGAYSSGAAYDVHPFILMNFTGTYDEVSTLAHEAGHTMHSYYSNKHQPFQTSDYTIFVAEVASTLNEHLLMDYMLDKTDDDAMRLFLLGSHLDNIRLTLFRQTQFAEFELKIHELVEQGEALTGERLNEVYGEILNAYYGVKEGITEINPVCKAEWAYIPHFYYNFYVFSYSTSITASTAISRMILEGRPGAVENYRKFLTLGNSLPPVEELKIAGVDMTTGEPFRLTMEDMNRTMDQIEEILDRMEG